MSFSWWCKDKNGKDLFKEFEINHQGFGLGPSGLNNKGAPHRLEDIRQAWASVPYTEKFEDAARDAMSVAQRMAQENLESLLSRHCETCSCGAAVPSGWSADDIRRFLSIPLDRVWRGGGGW